MSTAKKLIKTLQNEIEVNSKIEKDTYLKLVEVFPLKTIKTKKEYETALLIIERLIDFTMSSKNSGVDTYLNVISQLTSEYEAVKFKSMDVSAAEMLKYLMDLRGLKQVDLSEFLGGQSIVSNILNGKRELNLKQIRALAKFFKVSPTVFIL